MLAIHPSFGILNCFYFFILIFSSYSEGVYHEPLNIDDLTSFFGNEECIEGSLSVAESGNPVIKPSTYVSTEPSQLPTLTTKGNNDTINEKSPISLVYELAEFNQIKVQYTLTEEKGPAHKKQFIVSLRLGEEEYSGEGASIKKAQQEASKLALNTTLYSHPPTRVKDVISVENKKTYSQKLENWARKHSDALVTYSYFDQTQVLDQNSHKNYYHSGMYSKAKNIHKVKITIANQAFSGEGSSPEVAKENAAKYALDALQRVDGFCMLNDKERSFFKKVFDYNNDDNDNPISLVHEFGTLSNMPVLFELFSEEGLSHIKKFVFRSSVGNFETYGEGSSKKSAKRDAAQKMLEELKQHASFNRIECVEPLKKSKSKKKRSKNIIKSAVKTFSEEEEEVNNNVDFVPDELDPVSKLYQIQQAKHEVLPVFTLLQKTNNEFSMKVAINDLTAVGTGPNKKTAKKMAAQALLEQLGYSVHNRGHFSEKKRNDFSEKTESKNHIAPGIKLNSHNIHDIEEPGKSTKFKSPNKAHKLEGKPKSGPNSKSSLNEQEKPDKVSNQKSESQKKPNFRPKSQLINRSQQLGFKFQFSDFPKAHDSGYVSLLSLTTDPPKICYGVGETSDEARDKAALSALNSLNKAQIFHMFNTLEEENSAPPVKTEIPFIEEDSIVRSSIGIETE